MIDFKPNAQIFRQMSEKEKASQPYSPKASTCLSIQKTLTNALNNRMPQNNGASIQQPGTTEGFGRSM